MLITDPLAIQIYSKPLDCTLSVPGSKSITNRVLLLAALANGESLIRGALFSDDSRHMAECLRRLGFGIEIDEKVKTMRVMGGGEGGGFSSEAELFVGNAGTAARFLPVFVALGRGRYHFTAEPRMSQRPMVTLLAVLEKMGARVRPLQGTVGYPFELEAVGLEGGLVELDISESSQFASALLMAGPYMRQPLVLRLKGERREIPYIEMTLELMARFGIKAQRERQEIRVPLGRYVAQDTEVEPDISAACYFYGAGALLGGRVTIRGLGRNSLQGDIRFLSLLKHMGCQFFEDEDLGGLSLEHTPNSPLAGVDVDMHSFSDQALTLAAIAPFCRKAVVIRNIAHIRKQECDRLEAIKVNLDRLGVEAEMFASGDGIKINPAPMQAYHGAELESFDDHRVAMAFSLAGLKIGGVQIKNPLCVKKTFENYWQVFEEMRGEHA